ncbi:MAG TPA: FxSxx-COOH system tetratricopeptide repeat protein [Ktedonosporobacter sp.]|nr:FxSxx-COOH system tetratricopeptide repeat protein [Ktedonosporobacter sp.]
MTLTDDDASFGALVKTLRLRRHRTQQQLADALGVHRSTVFRWEQGTYLPENKAQVLELTRVLSLDDQDARHLLEASLTALAPYWSVPLPRNPYFTGREEILETLHTQLGVDQAVALTQSSALHGLGGIGKTQIALEYAYRHALEYCAVFWIAAETEKQAITSLLHVGNVLHLPECEEKDVPRVIAAVQRWLSAHGQWLLIWDNVQDLEVLHRFLPARREGSMLLTTRRLALGTLARGLDLAPMERQEGVLLLLRRAKVLDPQANDEQVYQFAARASAHYQAAVELVDALGGLPLALDQAGAYLEETRCGLPTYVELFRNRRAILLKLRGKGSDAHPAPVSTTIHLSVTATARLHPAVWDLLHVCALLSADAIPEELFCQGGKYLGTPLQAICSDPLEWDRLVSVACSYSLLSRQPEEQTLSMHRLVQAVLLDSMTQGEREIWVRRAIEALDAVFPAEIFYRASDLWKQGERFLSHALLCLHQAGKASSSLVLASLAHKVAGYLGDHGRYPEADPLFRRALSIREQALGPDHPIVAHTLHDLANLSRAQGKYQEADLLYQRALSIREQALGPDHPLVATTLTNLAILSWKRGKYEQVEALAQRSLSIAEPALGPDHPDVAHTLNLLGVISVEQGKYWEADLLFQRALSIWEQALGPTHHLVAIVLDNLATICEIQDQNEQADSLFRRALSIFEQALGPDHPIVAQVLCDLANLYRKQRRGEQAQLCYERALHIRESRLGQFHPETAETLYDLAVLWQKQDHLSEALALAERALTIHVQALGNAHPKTVACQALYAQLVQEQEWAGKEGAHSAQRGEEPANGSREGSVVERAILSAQSAATTSACEHDPLQEFLDACCELHPLVWCRISELWHTYVQWTASAQRRVPLSRRAFAAHLKARGCQVDRTNTTRIWRGIQLVKTHP